MLGAKGAAMVARMDPQSPGGEEAGRTSEGVDGGGQHPDRRQGHGFGGGKR